MAPFYPHMPGHPDSGFPVTQSGQFPPSGPGNQVSKGPALLNPPQKSRGAKTGPHHSQALSPRLSPSWG